MKYTQIVDDAIDRYKDKNKIASDFAFCKLIGLNRNNLSNWRTRLKRGQHAKIKPINWDIIEPYLREYLLPNNAKADLEYSETNFKRLLEEVIVLKDELDVYKNSCLKTPKSFNDLDDSKKKEIETIIVNMINLAK